MLLSLEEAERRDVCLPYSQPRFRALAWFIINLGLSHSEGLQKGWESLASSADIQMIPSLIRVLYICCNPSIDQTIIHGSGTPLMELPIHG
jgi:hypothetical protein